MRLKALSPELQLEDPIFLSEYIIVPLDTTIVRGVETLRCWGCMHFTRVFKNGIFILNGLVYL